MGQPKKTRSDRTDKDRRRFLGTMPIRSTAYYFMVEDYLGKGDWTDWQRKIVDHLMHKTPTK